VKVLLVEPYYTGSHAQWAAGYQKRSRHQVDILKLSGANWKWRMHGGAVTLARRFLESDLAPDVIVATDMLDLTTFQALTRSRTASVPMAVYFHENQLSYPWSPGDRDVAQKRDKHYGFINYASALASDAVYFNSRYHLESFFTEVDRLLKHFPDHNELGSIDRLRARSSVLRLGMDLRRFDRYAGGAAGAGEDEGPLVVWNHRWEYDKNPDEFFKAIVALADDGVRFRLAVLGENFSQVPVVFLKARDKLGERVVQFGYADDFETYAHWLHSADVLPVTSRQDFFGAGIAEAIYCGCRPLLPDRLAYPEIIPEKHKSSVCYDDYDEFLRRLRELLRERPAPANEELRAAMLRFDWETMAPQYDRAFESVAADAGAQRGPK
jgi:glycosyltransferase involved in cell wall biosynthesis